MATDVAILGGRRITLPAGWTDQRLVSVLGGADVDARATPGAGATLKIVALLGGARVLVPEGARVSVGGLALLGGRKVEVASREDGPEIQVKAFSVLGGIEISDRR